MNSKHTIYLLVVTVAMLFLLMGCSGGRQPPEASESLSGRSNDIPAGNWNPADGTYRINLRNAQSTWEFVDRMAERTGNIIRPVAVPYLDKRLALVLCSNLGMSLKSFDEAQKVVICVGV